MEPEIDSIDREFLELGASAADKGGAGDSPGVGMDAPPPMHIVLGGYEILREISRGGQAVVYQAIQRSTHRKVAIKVLMEGRLASKSARKRFEREVEIVAQLKHPNIVSIFDSGTTEQGLPYFAMDYVRGVPLQRYVRENKLTLEDTLKLFATVCEAVQYAHQKGVMHRDLKPTNILVDTDGVPKVLDFGLAKQLADPVETLVSVTGQVVGTLPYMSPEQVKGNPDLIDTRTDVYSLGVILYELLTGHYPYPVVGQMADVLKHIAETPPTPPSRVWKPNSGVVHQSSRPRVRRHCPIDKEVETIVLKSLAKARQRRYQDAGGFARDIHRYLAGEPIEARRQFLWFRRRHSVLWVLAPAIVVTLALIAPRQWRSQPSRQPAVRFSLSNSEKQLLQRDAGSHLAISSDGSRLAYVAAAGQTQGLYIRSLDQSESIRIVRADHVLSPFFSPDGQWVAFFTEGKLKKVQASGGPVTALCDVSPYSRGGTWSPDGTIIFADSDKTGLWAVSASGGLPIQVTALKEDERSHRWPQILPGSQAVLFTVIGPDPGGVDTAVIEVVSLESRQRTVLYRGGSYARYLPSGHLVFVRDGTLFATPVDRQRLEIATEPAPVLTGIDCDAVSGSAQYDFSATGTLVYHAGTQRTHELSPILADRNGSATVLTNMPLGPQGPVISPDGHRLAAHVHTEFGNSDIWTFDIETLTRTRLTFGGATRLAPIWSPDGKQLAYALRDDAGGTSIVSMAIDGGERVLTKSEYAQIPTGWSPDGQLLALAVESGGTNWDIKIFHEGDDKLYETYSSTPANETGGVISPDGRYLAYQSDQSGNWEVWVNSFSSPFVKWQISARGGICPRWSGDGKELFYVSGDELMSVPLSYEPRIAIGTPRRILEAVFSGYPGFNRFDMVPGGQGFVFLTPAETDKISLPGEMRVVLNWFDELATRVPTRE